MQNIGEKNISKVEMFKKVLPEKWYNKIKLHNPEFDKVLIEVGTTVGRLRKVKPVYPDRSEVFTAFWLTDIDDIKVVILGQDVYHTKGVAHGLAFSSKIESYIPPSLMSIYDEINTDCYNNEVIIRKLSPNLEYLAKQGVFLYNTSLTVYEGEANSHSGVWKKFTECVLNTIVKNNFATVWLLWGNYAKSYKKYIPEEFNHVLEASHPSPLSSSKGGWFGCKHFSKTNQILKNINKQQINWFKDEQIRFPNE